MATYTPNYNLNKPTFAELADVRTFNGNMDIIDNVMNASQNSIAEPYDSTETYDEGDMVMYELYLYKCLEETTGTWDATKWERAYSANSGAEIVYPQDATKYLNGAGQWTVPAGGGSSSGVYVDELIFDTYVDSDGTYSLIKSIDNYDALLICGYGSSGDSASNFVVSQFVTKAEFSKTHTLLATVTGETRRVFITFPDSTHVETSSLEGNISLRFIYGIKMSGDYYSPVIYSTEEREVGVWVDNKPLYQKTFVVNITLQSNSWTQTNLNIQNLDSIIKSEVARNDLSGTSDNGYIIAGIDIDHTNGRIDLFNFRNVEINVTSITIWYTKTTDTAGSGSYNTLGVPKVHYSTDEQVIGTWIDGSTIYQKTISLNSSLSINANSWGTVDTLNEFIQIIECNGLNEDNGEFASYPLGSNCDSNNVFTVLNVRNTAIDIKYITIKYLKPSV